MSYQDEASMSPEEFLFEAQRMGIGHLQELNGAIDMVYRNLDINVELHKAEILPGKEEGLLKALYQLYIFRYGRDPEEDGVILPQDFGPDDEDGPRG